MTLYAVPNQKVAFLYWQIVGESGTTTRLDNPLELSITEDVTITAVFTDNVVNGVAVSAVGAEKSEGVVMTKLAPLLI